MNKQLFTPKIIFTSFLIFFLFFSADNSNAQERPSSEGQWKSAGGQIVASGTHNFSQSDPPGGTLTGTITVQGPGYIGKVYKRIKSVSPGVHLKELNIGRVFIVRHLGSQDLLKGANGNWNWYPPVMVTEDYTPNANKGGFVPKPTADKPTTTFEIWTTIEGGGRENDERAIEYEFWYFPFDGGKVINSQFVGNNQISEIKEQPESKKIPDFEGAGIGRLETGTLHDKTDNKRLNPGDLIPPGHEIIKGMKGEATFTVFSKDNQGNITESRHELNSGTVFKINEPNKNTEKKQSKIFLFAGRLWSLFGKSKVGSGGYAIETYNSVLAVEGTSFETAYEPNTGETKLSVFEGTVSFECKTSDSPPLMVSEGITASFDRNCSPSLMATDHSVNTPAKAGWNISIMNNAVSTITHSPEGGLVPTSDSHVYAYNYSGWDKANWGKYEQLGTGWIPAGGEKRAYLKFDLTGIDPTTVNKATLKLYHNHTGGGNSAELGVYRLLSDWNEGRGTYNPASNALPGELSWVNQPTIDQYPVVYFNPGPGINKWIEVDITSLVKAWLVGVPNYGMAIKAGENYISGSESQYGFYSREYEDTDKRPQLVLNESDILNISDNQNTSIPEIVGDWKWFTDVIVTFHSDGRVTGSNNGIGTWEIDNSGSPYQYLINWSNGQYVDHLNLIGQTLKGVNQNGTTVSGVKIKSNNFNKNLDITVSGQWNANQNNGYKGILNLQQDQSGRISGDAIWNGYLKGIINGQVLGNAVEFTITYPNGDIGTYKGTLTQNGSKITEGSVAGNNGVSANWDASK